MLNYLCEVKQWFENLSKSESRHCAAQLGCGGGTLKPPPPLSCLVVAEALAGLLEVSVALLCGGEAHLGEVLPVEASAAQLRPLSLGAGPLHSQQLEVAG